MINNNKNNTNLLAPQIAGFFPKDHNIEFIGNRAKRTTLFIQNGKVQFFTDLPLAAYNLVKKAYLKDEKAILFCSKIHSELKDQVELYAYYMWGDADTTPDILKGILSPSENFRDQINCPSLLWESKNITIDNCILTPRQLVIIDMIADDCLDTVIATAIGVSVPHYNSLKRDLFHHTNTHTKTSLALKAKTQKVI
jgi:hypothetical protein